MEREKVYLFNGKNMEGWKTRWSKETPNWKVEEDGTVTVGDEDIISEYEFGDAHLHVEFRIPYMPDHHGQARGNSGVYVQAAYEVQVLDSYGIEDPQNNDCSGLYEMHKPLCNACLPPMEWQTYDIILRAPRFNQYGEVSENGRMTVIQNGIVVHNNVELPHVTPGDIFEGKRPAR
ncbi:MAG: DUF1080 domain-containing protein, partial [Clostridia bacterium]|nr:DUF1080 domain-containing protein [Clostridia bacterium]